MWNIHKRNIFLLLACIGAILLVVFLVLRPREGLLASQAMQIEVLKEEIAREKILLPIYKNLEKENEAFKPALLPNPEREVLDREQADKITLLIEDVSRQSRMRLISSVPDINSLTKTGKFLSVSMKLSGEFLDLSRFLTQLGEVPYIWHTEKIQVLSVPGTKEFSLTIWFAIQNGAAEEKKAQPNDREAKDKKK